MALNFLGIREVASVGRVGSVGWYGRANDIFGERAEDFPERHLPRWMCTGQDVGIVIVGVEGVLEVVAKKLGAGNVWKSFLFFLMGGRIPHHGIPLPRPLEFSV